MDLEEWNAAIRGGFARPATDFVLEVHHGGTFTCGPMKVYTGGKIDTIYGLDPDYISMLELEAMAKKFGYAPPVIFYCKKPKCNLDSGLVPITTDKDAYGMMELLHENRTAIVCLEHVGEVNLIESQAGSSNLGPTTVASQVDFNAEEHNEFLDFVLEPNFGIGLVNLESGVEWEYDNMEVGMGFGTNFGIGGVDDVNEEEEPRVDLGDTTDSSSDSVYYSDHSYHESDDAGLYEAFVDEEAEFVGVPFSNEKRAEVQHNDGEVVLSDEDAKYDSDYSFDTSSDEKMRGEGRPHLRNLGLT